MQYWAITDWNKLQFELVRDKSVTSSDGKGLVTTEFPLQVGLPKFSSELMVQVQFSSGKTQTIQFMVRAKGGGG